jgi:hypothetical protein
MEKLHELIDKTDTGPACLGWVPAAYEEFIQLLSENGLPGMTLEQFRQLEKSIQDSVK